MAIRIGALACVALVVLSSASAAFAQTTTRPGVKPKAKPTRTAPAPKPQDDQSYFGLDLPDSPGGKPPNYVYQSQSQSVFRGSMVGGDSTLFGGNFGVANPGLR